MSIKKLIIIVFLICFSFAIFLNIKYLQAKKVQINQNLVEVNYIQFSCSESFRMSSNIRVSYKSKEYNIPVSNGICVKISNGEIKPKFYYYKEKDCIFYENQFLPIIYVLLTYLISFLIPLLIIIFYRKELDNNISSM